MKPWKPSHIKNVKKRFLQHRGHEVCNQPGRFISKVLHELKSVPIFSPSIAKIDGFENPSQKIDGFGQTNRTHADGTTGINKEIQEDLL